MDELRRALAVVAMGSIAAMGTTAGAAQPASRADPARIGQLASEAGAWWMLVQLACDAGAAQNLVAAMNAALVQMGASDLQPLVAERIEEPHLDEASRLKMEAVMKSAAAVRRQVEEMLETKAALGAGRKPQGGLQNKEWIVARPIRNAADLEAALKQAQQALAQYCRQATAGVNATLLDADKGLVKVLR